MPLMQRSYLSICLYLIYIFPSQSEQQLNSGGIRAKSSTLLIGISSAESRNTQLYGTRHFAHERQEVLLGVAKKGQPQVVIGHARHQVRVTFELDALIAQLAVRTGDVGHIEVKNGTGMIKLWLLGKGQHQADSAAVKEGHVARGEQRSQAEHIPVKCSGLLQVMHVDRDLAQPGNTY